MFTWHASNLRSVLDTINDAIKHDMLILVGFDEEGNAILKVNKHVVDERGAVYDIRSFVDENNIPFLV